MIPVLGTHRENLGYDATAEFSTHQLLVKILNYISFAARHTGTGLLLSMNEWQVFKILTKQSADLLQVMNSPSQTIDEPLVQES